MKEFIIIFYITTLFTSSCSCQSNLNSEAMFLNHKKEYRTYISADSSSSISFIVPNDSIQEEYFTAILKDVKDDWIKISAYSPDTTIKTQGWIQSKYLVIKIVDFSKPILLYEKPTENTNSVAIKEYDFKPLQVIGLKSGWLKVKYKEYIGWLPPTNQCANPYTNCN